MIRMFDRSRRARLLFALLVTASLVLVTVDYRSKGNGPLRALGRAAMTVIGPVQEGLGRIVRPVGNFFAGFTKVPSLKERINLLERENADLRTRQEQLDDVYRENSSLRELLALRDRLALRTLPAQVIGVGPSDLERTLFVDRGTDDGVRDGMPVIGGAGLLGKVIEAGRRTAMVQLVVDRNSSVAGRLASTGETGLVSGTGGSDLRFEVFNSEAKVSPGDQVVTSGYDGGVYPPGIPIGSVAGAPSGEASLSRVATVRSVVDFTTLDYVLLVLGWVPQPAPSPSASGRVTPKASR